MRVGAALQSRTGDQRDTCLPPMDHRLINHLINLIKHYEKVLFTARFLGPTCAFKGSRPEYKQESIVETVAELCRLGTAIFILTFF
ncbi:unnamed protein product [Pieris brassicae]|uniref:Uncharacterized protein n=1 Tax=Pieris brassicae TaxID=7116 RepID=A0A9P0XH48_PIEBR|nr:unnamed protein product [Pieris brassicae]